jgi:cell division protein FtsQ
VNTKRIIQKVFFITLTLAACSGLVVLLVAAIGRKNHEHCKDYIITIKSVQNNFFIGEKDVLKLITAATDGKIKGETIAGFNLRKLEQLLEDNGWIQNANLYFDNRDVLHISVLEKEPVARIFTATGKSFYIDSNARQMPLSDRKSARVPVFTNFPDKKFLSKKDSALLHDIKKTALFILNDPFWMAQTEQIDITEAGTFEMVPAVGNHIVKLGNGEDIDKKFHRLFVFYQEVMSKTGFNIYNTVDVQYEGQVIGSKEKTSKVDSMQLRLNVEKLLREARQMQQDTISAMPIIEKENILPEQKAAPQTAVVAGPTNSNPVKTTNSAKPKLIVKKSGGKKPKAIMPERD